MNLNEALRPLSDRKKAYFKWKFDLEYDKTLPKKTEQELLESLKLKTMNTFYEWEKTEEYRNLVALLLNTRFDQDLEQIYSSLVDKAKTGDEKSIRLLLQMGKDIKEYSKQAVKQMAKVKNDEDDGLIM
ncbi:hypothetical protein [Paenibacillus sp. MSJ-34]|uniref:hypothetical protein n=1 Tax=Paenibacillus sp. MSJ-34 TaxID=2841529 RepID=UPI001C11132A|nr:hypothetical protein [Paenibacillus sp. MSJ-34]MBU5445634.1 hypothetical protein [Paenibacillus sp. MSJ-34]